MWKFPLACFVLMLFFLNLTVTSSSDEAKPTSGEMDKSKNKPEDISKSNQAALQEQKCNSTDQNKCNHGINSITNSNLVSIITIITIGNLLSTKLIKINHQI